MCHVIVCSASSFCAHFLFTHITPWNPTIKHKKTWKTTYFCATINIHQLACWIFLDIDISHIVESSHRCGVLLQRSQWRRRWSGFVLCFYFTCNILQSKEKEHRRQTKKIKVRRSRKLQIDRKRCSSCPNSILFPYSSKTNGNKNPLLFHSLQLRWTVKSTSPGFRKRGRDEERRENQKLIIW